MKWCAAHKPQNCWIVTSKISWCDCLSLRRFCSCLGSTSQPWRSSRALPQFGFSNFPTPQLPRILVLLCLHSSLPVIGFRSFGFIDCMSSMALFLSHWLWFLLGFPAFDSGFQQRKITSFHAIAPKYKSIFLCRIVPAWYWNWLRYPRPTTGWKQKQTT